MIFEGTKEEIKKEFYTLNKSQRLAEFNFLNGYLAYLKFEDKGFKPILKKFNVYNDEFKKLRKEEYKKNMRGFLK